MARGRSSARSTGQVVDRTVSSNAHLEVRGLPVRVRADAGTIVKIGDTYWKVDPPLTRLSDDGTAQVMSRKITESDPIKGADREVLIHTLYPEGDFRIERLDQNGQHIPHCPFGPAVSQTGLRGLAKGEQLDPRHLVKEWYVDGALHREDGPAVQTGDGGYEWHLDGRRHRIGGPAVMNPTTGEESWYEDDLLHRVDGPAVTGRHGETQWFLHGEAHRIGGPAIQEAGGYEEWRVHGKRHRIGGPAIVNSRGEEWWVEGQLHRANGPAVDIHSGPHAGHREWWLENRSLTEEEWQRERHNFSEASGRRLGAANPGSVAAAMNRR